MTLLPGLRLAVAPHFHVEADWPARLSLAAGIDATTQGPVARPPWRPPTAGELAALVPPGPIAREELAGCLCLFALPAHLRAAFWSLLAQAGGRGAVPAEGFDAFVAQTADFLTFKQMRPPAGAAFDLVASPPGLVTPLTASPLWGLINLGEDDASLVFLNVPEAPTADYPPVRLRLAPGEGARVPPGAPVGSDGRDRDQPEVLLRVRPPTG